MLASDDRDDRCIAHDAGAITLAIFSERHRRKRSCERLRLCGSGSLMQATNANQGTNIQSRRGASLYRDSTVYRSSAGSGLLIRRTPSEPGMVILQPSAPMETQMRKKVLIVFGMLAAALTIQMGTAAAGSCCKAARTADPVTQHLRDVYGSVDRPSTARSSHSNRSERPGLSAPVAADNKSCDIFSCYEN
jgi:hypothetical protein